MEKRVGVITLKPLHKLLARNSELKKEPVDSKTLSFREYLEKARVAQQQRTAVNEKFGKHGLCATHITTCLKVVKKEPLTCSSAADDKDEIIVLDDDEVDLKDETLKMDSNHLTSIKTETAAQIQNKTLNTNKQKLKLSAFSKRQKNRLTAMIRTGLQPEMAKKLLDIQSAKLRGVPSEESTNSSKCCGSKGRTMQHNLKKSQLNESNSAKMYYNYDLVIKHGKDPAVSLTLQEIQFIKTCLLFEIDVSECSQVHHQFVENYIRDGLWSITCQNHETKSWVMSTVPRLGLWPNANVKVVNISNQCRCMICLTHHDIMPKNLLLSRLQKQNCGLKTGKWRITNVEQSSNGETVWFTVDEQSKEIILRQKQKLWLNFSQIHVNIEGRRN